MPIYEYKSKNGAQIKKLFSRPFLGRRESFSHEGPLNYLEDEADDLELEDDLAEDEVWE